MAIPVTVEIHGLITDRIEGLALAGRPVRSYQLERLSPGLVMVVFSYASYCGTEDKYLTAVIDDTYRDDTKIVHSRSTNTWPFA